MLGSARESLSEADILVLCVADDAIVPLVRHLAKAVADDHRPIVLFTNGYLPLSVLAPLRRRGCAIGRFHPLASVPSLMELTSLTNAPFGLEGDSLALRAAKGIVKQIEGTPLELASRRGAAQAYHAGASLLGGGLVALFHLAERVMGDSVTSRTVLRDALHQFADMTLFNTKVLGPKQALTGALARGSQTIVRGHLRALARVPEALEFYRLLGRTMLDLAHARGSIDKRTRRRLLELILAGHLRLRGVRRFEEGRRRLTMANR